MLVVLDEDLGSQFQAVGGHPALRPVARGVVDHATAFSQGVIRLRFLVDQGRRVKAFRGVIEPAPWVAEGEFRIRTGYPCYS